MRLQRNVQNNVGAVSLHCLGCYRFSHHHRPISRSDIPVCNAHRVMKHVTRGSDMHYPIQHYPRDMQLTMPPYVNHRSILCRRSMTRNSELDSPTVLSTSSILR